jgi:hypothetical protein
MLLKAHAHQVIGIPRVLAHADSMTRRQSHPASTIGANQRIIICAVYTLSVYSVK